MEVMLAIALIILHQFDHKHVPVFELHNRKLIDPVFIMLYTACYVYVKSLMVLPPHSGSGQSLMGVNIVQTRALALPGACNVQTPSIGRCNASSPTDSPSGTPNSPPAVPSTDNGTSDANSTKLTMSQLFFLLLFTASYASTLEAPSTSISV